MNLSRILTGGLSPLTVAAAVAALVLTIVRQGDCSQPAGPDVELRDVVAEAGVNPRIREQGEDKPRKTTADGGLYSSVDLGGLWDIINANGSIRIQGQVPGTVHTALLAAGVINNPYYRFNDVTDRWVVYDRWTYSRSFTVTADEMSRQMAQLVCHGLDSVAEVFINGLRVGVSNNQFVTYNFDVKGIIQEGTNSIRVEFQSAVDYAKSAFDSHPYLVPPTCPPPEYHPECHANFIRKAQCSFSWDWGPAFPTQGIWKPLILETFDLVVVRSVTPFSFKDIDGIWHLKVTVYFDVSADVTGKLRVDMAELGSFVESDLTIAPGSSVATVIIDTPTAESWWPRGYGQQKLYVLSVSFTPAGFPSAASSVSLKTGFRTVQLIQDAMTEGLTFYFKVNGIPVFMKGSNWIPMDSFLDTVTYDRLRRLLQSAVDVNMNSIRIWGGGVYESDDFYDICDELGLLVWQDMMFACSMYPVDTPFLDSVTLEMDSQVKRLARHPCLVAWTANNENEGALVDNWYGTAGENYELYKADYVTLYIDTVRAAILRVDPSSRPFLSSSPTNGLVTEQSGWISEVPRPSSPLYGDVHFYNYVDDCLDYTIFPPTRYASEYGYQSWPSYHTLKHISVPAEDLYYGSEFWKHREHHPGAGNGTESIILRHFGGWPDTGDKYKDFHSYIYLTQVAQAICYQSETEFYRRSRSNPDSMTMGALYWQHNDIWQAPSWATIDYYGNWKMAHYFAARFFADPIISIVDESPKVSVYTVTDSLANVTGVQLVLQLWTWNTIGTPLHTWNVSVDVRAAGSFEVFNMNAAEMLSTGGCKVAEECILLGHLEQPGTGNWMTPENVFYFVSWKDALGMQDPQIQVTDVHSLDVATFSVTIRSVAPAAFTWLEAVDIAGRFSDNGFVMTQAERVLTFHAWTDDVTADALLAAIAVTSLYDVM